MRANSWKYKRSKTNNSKKKAQHQISFLLTGDDQISINIPYKTSDMHIKTIVKSGCGVWDSENKLWVIKKSHYEKVLEELRAYCEQKQILCHKIPQSTLIMNSMTPHQIKIKTDTHGKVLKYPQLQTHIEPQTLPFYDKLYDFQKQSLKFGIQKHGRLLLADEMGVGKTIQSLAIAYIYKFEWPLLIICPSTLRLNWRNQIFTWYGSEIQRNQVQVYSKGKTPIRKTTKILIISYDLAWKNVETLSKFQVAIADEAHYLKNSGSKRTDILVPLLTEKRRVILLTGTPAFARPRQIFNLASVIRPDLFYYFTAFGNRYCDPQRNHWSGQIQYNGCKNSQQLYYLLKDRIMMRRLKKDVLKDLPDKQRQKVTIQTDKKITKQINALLNNQNKHESGIDMQNIILKMFNLQVGGEGSSHENNRQVVMEAYKLSGLAKIQGSIQYILSLLQNNVKILIFAHHQAVLNEIQSALIKNNYQFIRIDGQVQINQRQDLVNRFQNQKAVTAALLSITAAGVGLTLTASSTVVFAELHWTPGMLIQAEDRAHRITQKNCVNCHYLIGEDTLDDILYSYLLKKINDVSTFVDGTQHHLEMENVEKGKVGKVSKYQSGKKGQNRASTKKATLLEPILKKRKLRNQQIVEDQSDISSVDKEQFTKEEQEQKLEYSSLKKIKTDLDEVDHQRILSRRSDRNYGKVREDEQFERKSSELIRFIEDNKFVSQSSQISDSSLGNRE